MDEQIGRLRETLRELGLAVDALAFMDRAKNRINPFMVFLAFNASYDPRQSPKEYVDMHPMESMALPPSHMDMYPFKDTIGRITILPSDIKIVVCIYSGQ